MPWSAEHNGYTENEPKGTHDSRTTVLRRAVAFFVVFALLELGWQTLRGTAVEWAVIHHATVRPAVALANFLTPAAQVQAVAFSLRAPGGGLNILNGCEGVETLLLLLAAFVVAPLAWRTRLYGLCLGIGLVYGLNLLRILLLFYAYRADPGWFYTLHSSVAPIVLVLVVAGYFYAWTAYARVTATTA